MTSKTATLITAAALLTACGPQVDNGPVIDTSQPTLVVQDAEPNNDPCCAQGLGFIGAFEQWRIEGYVDDKYGLYVDEVDAYAFAAAGPIDVEFGLYGEQYYSWDADLGLFDPFLEQWIFVWDTYDQDEFGAFVVDTFGEEFHMVVIAALGAGDYRLDLNVLPALGFSSKDDGPNAEALELDGEPKAELDQAFEDYRASAETARVIEANGIPLGVSVEVGSDGEVRLFEVRARESGLTATAL